MSEAAKISVVMATYNGQRYIFDQISSILNQLEAGDELIIIDDCSTDKTISVIKGFDTPKIKLFENPVNLGVLVSFEMGLRRANNPYIFLSDQDDVWKPSKRQAYVATFDRFKDIAVIISDLEVIDGFGTVISRSFMDQKGGFKGGVLNTAWRNRYIGCSMAIRRSILNIALPFPKAIPMHDMWLGLVGEFFGGTRYLPEPYIQYRRHGRNVTSLRRSSLAKIIMLRLKLLFSLFLLMLRVAALRFVKR